MSLNTLVPPPRGPGGAAECRHSEAQDASETNKYTYIIEYGHEAKPSILWIEIVLSAARRDDYGGGYCRARQKL